MDSPQTIIEEIETRAAELGVRMDAILKRAQVHRTTWHRWKIAQTAPRYVNLKSVTEAAAVLFDEAADSLSTENP